MLKRILILIVSILAISSLSFAADLQKSVTFGWQQDTESLDVMSDGGGWVLYVSDTQGGPYSPALDKDNNPIFIPYDSTPQSDYTSNQTLLIDGSVGSTVTKYFTLAAKSKDNDESDKSNEASLEVKIPIGVPFTFTIKVN